MEHPPEGLLGLFGHHYYREDSYFECWRESNEESNTIFLILGSFLSHNSISQIKANKFAVLFEIIFHLLVCDDHQLWNLSFFFGVELVKALEAFFLEQLQSVIQIELILMHFAIILVESGARDRVGLHHFSFDDRQRVEGWKTFDVFDDSVLFIITL